ncbi:hypothetical protein DOX58_14690 [Cronobacter sakazakii]|nr:hypothetical protein [Cronobacter sakazakii]ELY2893872.1 DUF2238 domain-containing protein [Cronobacter sakazakii]
MTVTSSRTALTFAALVLALILIYTGISAKDKLTWLMEVTPVIIIVPLLLAIHSRYPLTPLLYVLIFFHAIILMVGGMYTYAKVPIGFDVQAWLGLSRNPYDKLGHFFQGLVPALALGQGADDFLGTQGDPWDTQSDMFCALLGALTTVFALSRWHTKQLVNIQRP